MANATRKAEEDAICADIDELMQDSGINSKLYREKFAKMSDEEFHQMLCDVRDKKVRFVVTDPVFNTNGVTAERNVELAAKWGRKIWQTLIYPATSELPERLSAREYMVTPYPTRRQRQIGQFKNSTAKDSSVTDIITGQAAGDSAAGKISSPEAGAYVASGYNVMLQETMTARGGDKGMMRAMEVLGSRTGEISLEEVKKHATGVEALDSMNSYLAAMHIRTTLKDEQSGI